MKNGFLRIERIIGNNIEELKVRHITDFKTYFSPKTLTYGKY